MAPTAKNYCFTSFSPNAPAFLAESMVYLCFQKETCPTTSRTHWQGFVSLKARRALTSVKRLLGGDPHIEAARGTPEECRDYCRKEDTAVGGTFEEFGILPLGKGARNDLHEVVKAVESDPYLDFFEHYPEVIAKYPRFCSDLRKRCLARAAAPEVTVFVPREGWQRRLVRILDAPVDARKVHWFVDPVGGSGKSFFGSCWRSSNGKPGFIVTGGRHTDIYYAYEYQSVVFFDWSRAHEDTFPYGVVESFKNGYFLSTKYESKCVTFRTPHVVIFSNFDPDRTKLSNDRWDVHNINSL